MTVLPNRQVIHSTVCGFVTLALPDLRGAVIPPPLTIEPNWLRHYNPVILADTAVRMLDENLMRGSTGKLIREFERTPSFDGEIVLHHFNGEAYELNHLYICFPVDEIVQPIRSIEKVYILPCVQMLKQRITESTGSVLPVREFMVGFEYDFHRPLRSVVSRKAQHNGLSLRCTRFYDPLDDTWCICFDGLFGIAHGGKCESPIAQTSDRSARVPLASNG